MEVIWEGLVKAFWLLVERDPEVVRVTFLSLQVSGVATLLSLGIGIPVGTALALTQFRGRQLVVSMVNTGMGMPPVVVGLFVTIMLWRNGPLGELRLLFTPSAMVLAQTVIAAPMVTGVTLAAMGSLNPRLRLQILALGATRWQLLWLLVRETRLLLLAAVMAGFGAVISEVGASMMVGGNILGQTRVLTTATVMESSKGNFDVAIALGIILLLMVYAINLILTYAQQRRRPM
ncbi:MAG TPA: ABC transporter permease [Chloroflexota bacterium]|nr:ABC transporter permease [Chloroflexota bacterium]